MKAVSELKEADYSRVPELESIYRRLSSGREQFAGVLDKNIKAVMQYFFCFSFHNFFKFLLYLTSFEVYILYSGTRWQIPLPAS